MAKASIQNIMRKLHRDIGAFAVGLTLVFCISGVALIYRDTGAFIYKETVEKNLSPGLNSTGLKFALRLHRMNILEENPDEIIFSNGRYNKKTGYVKYETGKYPDILSKLNRIHTAFSGMAIHYISLVYGICLLFLAVSSFFMYKPGSSQLKRVIFFSSAGIVASLAVLFFV